MPKPTDDAEVIRTLMEHGGPFYANEAGALERAASSVERGYSQGYHEAITHAVSMLKRIPDEQGWLGARTVKMMNAAAAAIRSLSP